MRIEDVIREMRRDDCMKWADALEAAMQTWLSPETYDELMRERQKTLHELARLRESVSCPHIVTNGTTSYCDLAESAVRERDAEIERLQARIDELMLEFCPDEITPEQWARYCENVALAKEDKP